ncbi:hypothetical protein [Spirosoma arcticum]
MKKRTEKQPVDDLFARRLKNMSLPPSPNGFARLQARMGQSEPERRVVFWQNPTAHRYMAVAACLLLTCLFGWLYLTTETPRGNETTVAVNKSVTTIEKKPRYEPEKSGNEVATANPNSDREVPSLTDSGATNPSIIERSKLIVSRSTNNRRIITAATRVNETAPQGVPAVIPTSMGELAKAEVNSPSVEPTIERQMPATTDKPTPVAERVLIVTIAEPKSLIAARQLTRQPSLEDVAAATDKSEKDSKVASLWQQVKRVKQGEIFARKDAGEDEGGLLGRAYTGLKQTFDKDKSIKQ